MLGFAHRGPWTEPLNWNLHTTSEGEACPPFHLYVDPKQTKPSPGTFHPFLQLPAELQLRIMHFCDAATLFQLMHASSTTRHEAKKLFWSNSDTRFLIRADWLLNGGYSGHTLYSTDIMACVKQIEVDFHSIRPFDQRRPDDCKPGADGQYERQPPDHVRDEEIYKFWQTVAIRFPRVTDVILSERAPFETEAKYQVTVGIILAAERCPIGIRTSVSFVQRTGSLKWLLKRNLWRQVQSASDSHVTWEVVDPSWTRLTVLPPPKTFHGPFGAYCRARHLCKTKRSLQCARWVLMIQATEAYYLDRKSRFTCPESGCNLQFEKPGQWAAHAIDTCHHREITAPTEPLRALFKDRLAWEERVGRYYDDTMDNMRAVWGKEGSRERREAKSAFLYQIAHDPLYMLEESIKNLVWQQYESEMDDDGYGFQDYTI